MTSHLSFSRKRNQQMLALVGTTLLTLLMAAGAPAGIQGSGFRSMIAVGTVTSVDSGTISVDGSSYSTGSASVDIDDEPGSKGQLRVGDVVTLSGSADGGQVPATAERIDFSSNVRGPVSNIDLLGGTIEVLGQTVRTTPDTVFSGPLKLPALAGILLGDVIEVSGFGNAEGEIVASRIDAKAANTPLRVVGSVHSLNPTQKTFSINSLVINFAGGHLQGTLTEGANVSVEASASSPSLILLATKVTLRVPLVAQASSEGRIEGIITNLPSSTYFEINGLPVAITSQTRLNSNARLSLDSAVRVTGHFTSGGVLVAERVQKSHSDTPSANKGLN
jgi:hypothetical protein